MDVIDPAIAPNVGNPTPGGLFISEVETIIETLARKNVVGFDVVETVSDRLGDNTAVVAAKIIYDFLTCPNNYSFFSCLKIIVIFNTTFFQK